MPPTVSRGGSPVLLGLSSVRAEHDLMDRRLGSRASTAVSTRSTGSSSSPSVRGSRCWRPGRRIATLRRALQQLGIDGEDELDRLGIRLVRLGLAVAAASRRRARVRGRGRSAGRGRGQASVRRASAARPALRRARRAARARQARRRRWRADCAVGDGRRRPGVGGAGSRARRPASAIGHGGAPDASRASAPAPLPVARTPFFCSGCRTTCRPGRPTTSSSAPGSAAMR